MKRLLLLAFLVMSLASCASCNRHSAPAENNSNKNTNPTGTIMKIKVGSSIFTAHLYDNATATSFKALLPLTIQMTELNGNEKYAELPRSLATKGTNPGTIQDGDLMLYGSSTLVLFYKTFPTLYSYTPLGRIDDVTGLVAALGTGNIIVRFELE